jgi:hypothetical protein
VVGGAGSVSMGTRGATSGGGSGRFRLEEIVVVGEEIKADLVIDGRCYLPELQII